MSWLPLRYSVGIYIRRTNVTYKRRVGISTGAGRAGREGRECRAGREGRIGRVGRGADGEGREGSKTLKASPSPSVK